MDLINCKKDKECRNVNTCKYTFHRFGVLDCEPATIKKQKIEAKHQKELQDREEMLKNLDKVNYGNNYNKKIDFTYKDSLINYQSKGKRRC